MTTLRITLFSIALLGCTAAGSDDSLQAWRTGVQVQPVAPGMDRHSIHTYFNTSPESPDGKLVLFYTSTAPDGQHGDIRVRDRASGAERVVATNINTEDAHRAACQQWISNGKRVVFHNERDGEWYVAAVDLESGNERILAPDRLVCWGQPHGDVVPIYGKHWNPGPHRDLELLNVATGAIEKPLTADAVKEAYPAWWGEAFRRQTRFHLLSRAQPRPEARLLQDGGCRDSEPAEQGGERSRRTRLLRPRSETVPLHERALGSPGVAPGFAPNRRGRLHLGRQ